jgi:hypothetical protein
MKTTKIEITYFSPRYLGYSDWLLTGLEILREQNKIDLLVKYPSWYKPFMFSINNCVLSQRLFPNAYRQIFDEDHAFIAGELIEKDKKVFFVCDFSDTPYSFASGLLETADVYFKFQCPKKIDEKGFPLTTKVNIPYHPNVLMFKNKIRPGMLGRPLSYSLNFGKSVKMLKEFEQKLINKKNIKIYASFGTDAAPNPVTASLPVYSPHNVGEGGLQKTYFGMIDHPNLKRGKTVEILRDFKKNDIYAAVFDTKNDRIRGPLLSTEDYLNKLTSSSYSVNISGRRRSIPYRFLDSLMCGTSVATDDLAVRWYKDFEVFEAYEFGTLGYECSSDINWNVVKEKLWDLYESHATLDREKASALHDRYKKNWSPIAFANYFVSECKKSIDL